MFWIRGAPSMHVFDIVRRRTAASSMHPLDAPRFLHCRPSRRPAMGGWNSHDDSLELWNSGELQTTHIRVCLKIVYP